MTTFYQPERKHWLAYNIFVAGGDIAVTVELRDEGAQIDHFADVGKMV